MAELTVMHRRRSSFRIRKVFLLPILFAACFWRSADAGDLSLAGYIKSYLFVYRPVSAVGPQSVTELSTNRVRLNLIYRHQNRISMNVAYDFVPRFQSEVLQSNSPLPGQINPFTYRISDLKKILYPAGTRDLHNFALGQNLDRASVAFHTRQADITIGRQAIAWGSARAINPTDVLAPFPFEALDTEDRIGIDAVRAQIPLGTLSELDAGFIFGKGLKFANDAFYGRTKFNLRKTDISLLFMGFRENALMGFDLARSIGGAGFWLESACVFPDAFDDELERSEAYFRISTGMDYSFSQKTYSFVEYHFNGAGASLAGDYAKSLANPAYTEGSDYLLGRHYLIPGTSYQLTPLIALTGQALINMTDRSLYLTPQAEYNIASNLYIGAGAFIAIGRRPSQSINSTGPALRSEFGSYPSFYFGSIRYYF